MQPSLRQPVPRDAPTRGLLVFDLERTLFAGAPPRALWGGAPAARVLHGGATRAELSAARVRTARVLSTRGVDALRREMAQATLLPAARELVAFLQRNGVACALASLGWDFAVEAVAQELGIRHHLATGLERSGAVVHVWQEDKEDYRRRLAEQLRLPHERSLLLAERVALSPFGQELVRRWA